MTSIILRKSDYDTITRQNVYIWVRNEKQWYVYKLLFSDASKQVQNVSCSYLTQGTTKKYKNIHYSYSAKLMLN